MSRSLSFSNTQPIAYGRLSEIFDIGNEKVLKLYNRNFPRQKIQTEFQNAKVVFSLGKLLVSQPFEVVEVGERTGIVFAKIAGRSYMDLFQQNPLLYFTKAKTLANIHQQIHILSAKGIATQTQVFSPLIRQSSRLSKKEKETLISILNLPHNARLCHGDFHHGNIMKANDGQEYILDWMNAFMGDPRLDIALTAVNAAVSDAPQNVPKIYRVGYEFLKKLLALDRQILGNYPELKREDLPQLILLAAGVHLVKKDGDDFTAHRRYFECAMTCATNL